MQEITPGLSLECSRRRKVSNNNTEQQTEHSHQTYKT